MTIPPAVRARAAEAIAKADGRQLGLEPLADATYEQMADAVLEIVSERLESAGALMTEFQRLAEFVRQRNLVLSGLLRGMARRAVQYRRAVDAMHRQLTSEHAQAVEDWGRNDEAMLAENQRLADQVQRLTAELAARDGIISGWVRQDERRRAKPNPWFTPAAEFPLEAAERADREAAHRPSIGYAFSPQEHREEQVDLESLTGAAAFDRAFPPACGQIHDGTECLEPRVPETNGCWVHYGPPEAAPLTAGELDEVLDLDADTVRTPGEPRVWREGDLEPTELGLVLKSSDGVTWWRKGNGEWCGSAGYSMSTWVGLMCHKLRLTEHRSLDAEAGP
ncbi:hypothetical protein SAMN05216188_11870 [Lentzea xinjiangensis]|uniref:Uncharacterized protein n=1 Tax=Lentzea xinjiangensis TaxID=402600 RepID=A0A1H9TEY6_9PSEU|nr:hypothetical protein [Lentzea xinjiangensis]SER95534.1 hypothetical protein SAMN05216188_11870 [Lentzea xinjiangensis]